VVDKSKLTATFDPSPRLSPVLGSG
jgi:hypothetical protein